MTPDAIHSTTAATVTTVADVLRDHLAATGQSGRALSLAAGLNEKAVRDILAGRTQRPHTAALEKLSLIVGRDLTAIPMTGSAMVSDVLAMLQQTPPSGWSASALRGAASALKLYGRLAGKRQGPDFTPVDRVSVRNFLASSTPASLGVSPATWNSYASHLRAVLDLSGGTGRRAQIRDVTGRWRQLYDAVAGIGLPKDLVWAAGPFFAWCDSQGLGFSDVVAATFVEYRSHRVGQGRVTVGDARDTKAAKRARDLWNHLAARPAFADLGVRAVEQPFTDGRVRYATPEALLAPLLAEFDEQVVPWATGRATPQGRPVDAILDELEAVAAPPKSAKIARVSIGIEF